MTKEERLARQREWSKERYAYRKANRLCTYCGNPLKPEENIICDADRKKETDRRRNTYHYYQDNGYCPVCHEVKLLPGEKRCAVCKRFRNNLERDERKKQTDRDSHKRLRDKRREKGLCTICGKAPADEGHVTCKYCRTRKKWFEKKRRKSLFENSRCTTCGKLIMTGKFRTCPECREYDAVKRGRKSVSV